MLLFYLIGIAFYSFTSGGTKQRVCYPCSKQLEPVHEDRVFYFLFRHLSQNWEALLEIHAKIRAQNRSVFVELEQHFWHEKWIPALEVPSRVEPIHLFIQIALAHLGQIGDRLIKGG